VESVVHDIQAINAQVPIVVRSTVPPGTCERLGVHHMPEFLTEARWDYDFRQTDKWVIGVNKTNPNHEIFRERIAKLLHIATRDKQIKGNETWWATTTETELTKYARNAFLATKLSFFNEIEEFSRKLGTNYQTVRDMTTIDSRIGAGHSFVPASDGKRGFSGTCLPKDLKSLQSEMESHGMTSYIVKAVWERNVNVDRPTRDWEKNIGRSFVDSE